MGAWGFLLTQIMVVFFLKRFKTPDKKSEMEKLLKGVQGISFALLGVGFVIEKFAKPGFLWAPCLFFAGWYMLKDARFSEYRQVAWGVIAFSIVYFILTVFGQFFPLTYKEYSDLAGFISTAFYAAPMVLLYLKKREGDVIKVQEARIFSLEKEKDREVEQERQQRVREELYRRMAESRKSELEELVAERTREITKQKEELQEALKNLEATQDQLIQAEKMAALGELTAGIAHEIQNPLNFVNNFSEVSVELLEELRAETSLEEGGDSERETLIAELFYDLSQNLEKIQHHGKRADSIVKGMLQHSRASSGQKELTDINDLADEYLRLSYHGIRARDKSFNAAFRLDADGEVGQLEVVPQDLGRVLLNILNNAFYAVSKVGDRPDFKPTVVVSTKKLQNSVEIRISDNGTGISDDVKSKIFQPFFTTKPTGEGTGLGLSLSYDIITKGHRGELEVESESGKGTQFIITLPLTGSDAIKQTK